MTHALDGFSQAAFTHDGVTRPLLRAGSGPTVIVIHEAPGITPEVASFGRRVVDRGFSVAMPSLFGTPGKRMTAGYTLRSIAAGCVAREFATFAVNRTSPITSWLVALARREHAATGGPGVGVVGMCFTGGFALGMMVDPTVLAPVCSQPSLPFAIGRRRKAAVGISDQDLARLKARVSGGACVLGLRFSADKLVPPERFATLRRELGDGFIAVELDSAPGNPHGTPSRAHSVLTNDLVDEPGHPTREALERVLAFLAERLRPAAS